MKRRHMPTPRVGCAVLIVRAHRVLLGQSLVGGVNDKWVIPNQPIRYGESIAKAAQRGMHDVTGYHVNVGDVIETREIIAPEAHQILLVMIGKPVGGQATPGGDLASVHWCSRQALKVLADHDELTLSSRAILRSQGWLP